MQDPTDSLQEVADCRHELMVPLCEGRFLHPVEFCGEVASEAYRIAHELAMDSEWRKCLKNERPSAVHQAVIECEKSASLLEDTQRLMDNLRKFGGQNDTDPLLVLVLDEASSLFTLPRERQ